ncbi:MAG: hypothetical protein HQ495_15115 [Alphaproteobacteria bacterium]|nr:hypothetical protein [Alphaproteobacteria bacterium]
MPTQRNSPVRFRRAVAFGAVALALAGCTGTVVGGGFPSGSYNRDTVTYLAVTGPIPVRTIGNPYGGTQEALTQAVAEQFHLPGGFTPATFAPATPEATKKSYHLTFVFNPESPPDVRDVCGGEADQIPLKVAPGTLRIVAAYCYRDEAINRVSARAPATGPGSVAFATLLDQISLSLFPPSNPNIDPFWRRRKE